MKSRIIPSFRAMSPWPSRDLAGLPAGLSSGLSRAGIALGSAISVLSLAGCYYPYGYYPSGYYSPAYVPPPATTTQQGAPADQADSADTQQPAPAQAQAQAQMPVQVPNAAYAVAAPPVYAAPVYPAYYPPPVYPAYPAYPAYYGYPYWGPSVSIGFGGYWGGGWGGRHWH